MELAEDGDELFMHNIKELFVNSMNNSSHDVDSDTSVSFLSSLFSSPSAYFEVNNNSYRVLMDTGCEPYSCISLSLAKKLNLHINPMVGNIILGDGSSKPRLGQTDELQFTMKFLHTPLKLPSQSFHVKFVVLEKPHVNSHGVTMDFICGKSLLREYCKTLDKDQNSSFVSILLSMNTNPQANDFLTRLCTIAFDDENNSVYFPEDDLDIIHPKIISSADDDIKLNDQRQASHDAYGISIHKLLVVSFILLQ